MSRNLDNLKRLFRKLQGRYGDHDEVVSQLKDELDSREAIESGFQQLVPYRDGLPGHAA